MARDVQAERVEIEQAIAGRTVLTMFEQACRQHPHSEAHRWKEDGEWRSRTWFQYRDQVRLAALGLKELGFGRGQFGLIMARNRPEHLVADLAILHAGGTPVSVYNTFSDEQVAYIAGHCNATVAIVEDARFHAKFIAIRENLPQLETIVVIDPAGVELEGAAGLVSWAQLLERGRHRDERDPNSFGEWMSVRPEDLATLIYTSGTTGHPKAVMLTHRNVLWMAKSSDLVLREVGMRHVSYLPFAHVFERFIGHYYAIMTGALAAFCPDPGQLVACCREVRPSAFIGVPRIWEKLRAVLQSGIDAEPTEEARNSALEALGVGRELVRCQQADREPPADLVAAAAAVRPIWKSLLAQIGLDECRWACSGAAPINVDVIEFFQALGLKLWEGWGMSECTVGGSYNPLDRIKNGSVGIADPGVELRLGPDGELLVRGGNVMKGYYKDPERTAETIDPDGWLHTGDIATIDGEGYVRIIDRKKELIITAGGKNISPANLEALLKEHPLIGQACVVGDRRSFLTALIVPDHSAASGWARRAGITFDSLAELTRHPALRRELESAVQSANARVSRAEGIKRFMVLPSEWTTEAGELTPTLKLKRRVILDKYAAEIEQMYAESAGAASEQDRVTEVPEGREGRAG